MALKAIIGLLVVAAIGGGAWYVSSNPKTEAGVETGAPINEDNASTGTFADLMARVGPWQCEAKAEYEGGQSEGTVLMNDGKIRGDFVASMAGRVVNTSFVSVDGYIYTWSDLLPQGMKVKVDAAAGTAGGQGIDPATPVEYSCVFWNADESKFSIPSDIEFFEIGTQGSGGFNIPVPR